MKTVWRIRATRNSTAIPILFILVLLFAGRVATAQTNWNGTWMGNFNGTFFASCGLSTNVSEPQQFVFAITSNSVAGSGSSSGFLCVNGNCQVVDTNNYAGAITGSVLESNIISFTYTFTVLDGLCNGYSTNVTGTATNNGTNITGNWNGSGTFTLTNETVMPATPQIEVFYGASIITNNQSAVTSLGFVGKGQISSNITYTIFSSGNQPLSIRSITVPTGFSVSSNVSNSLTSGSEVTFTIQLNTSALGSYSGNVVISNNDPTNGVFSIPVSGSVTGAVVSLAGNLIFGSVVTGTSAQSTLVLSNAGNAPLTVTNIVSPVVFALSWSNGTIASGASTNITVTFSPPAAGVYGGTIGVVSDAVEGTGQIAVSGTGIKESSDLTLIDSGPGRVSPNLNGKPLVSGRHYTLTAIASSGYIFSGWTGTIVSDANPLTFEGSPGEVLQANFVPNPFEGIKGTFNGLFSTIDGVTEATAGIVRGVTINKNGTYSGTLLLNGARHGLSGKFNAAGQATKVVPDRSFSDGVVTVNMTLTNPTGMALQLRGTVSNASFVASLLADIGTNTVSSGHYGLLIPPDTNNSPPTYSPGGDGFLLIANNAPANSAAASATISGSLADGTTFTQVVPVSTDGYTPVYASINGNKGLITGWINLVQTNSSTIGLTWFHPAQPSKLLYPEAFTSTYTGAQLPISLWFNSTANFTAYVAVNIAGTNIPVSINNAGKIKGASVNGSVNTKTGEWTITAGTGRNTIKGYGVILANSSTNGGYFLTKTSSQAVFLQP